MSDATTTEVARDTPPEDRPSAARRNRLALAFESALLALLAWRLWIIATAVRTFASAPFQYDYGEGNVLATAVRLAHGLSPYPDPRAFPNAIDPYGPVGYYLLALPVKWFGVTFLYPRLLVIAAAVSICLLLALIIFKFTRSSLAALLFGFSYLAIPMVHSQSFLLRVDFLGLALTVAGLHLFARGLTAIANRQSPIGNSFSLSSSVSSVASLVLFVAAIFCKHSLIAAPLACLLVLLSRRRWREALRFAGIAVALGILAFAAAEVLTRGFFAQHLFLTHPDPFSWNQYAVRMAWLARMCAPLLALAVIEIIVELRAGRLSLPMWWFLLATAVAITSGKQGSNWNHLLEWTAALCLCAGLGWASLGGLRPARFARLGTIALALWLAAWFIRPPHSMFDWSNGAQQCPQAYAYVRDHPGDRVLSENLGAVLLGGKTAWVLDPFVYSQIVMHGTWPDDVIEPRLRSQWFDQVITRRQYRPAENTDRFSPEMLTALNANYRVARSFQCTDANTMWERKTTSP
ncbi:MAG: hypothetical protein ACR2IF_04455 [Terriglobales bacterium]